MADHGAEQSSTEQSDAAERTRAEKAREHEDAHAQMREFEQQDELPSDLSQWPDGKAKYVTFDTEGDAPYGEGLTEKLGPAVVHHEDGSVSADGEKVDNPEDYKGEPIELAIQINSPDQPSEKPPAPKQTPDEEHSPAPEPRRT